MFHQSSLSRVKLISSVSQYQRYNTQKRLRTAIAYVLSTNFDDITLIFICLQEGPVLVNLEEPNYVLTKRSSNFGRDK